MANTVSAFILSLCLVACQSTDTQGTLGEIEAVRLVGGSNVREGRVEVLVDGYWGTVCDDVFDSDNNAAKVVCRSLGFQSPYSVRVRSVHFGIGTGSILLDDVRCVGNETTLNECRRNAIGVTNCNHAEDVGVICSANNIESIPGIRLVNGSSSHEGRLEVQLNNFTNVWGTVCDDGFRDEEAQVVCRTLGFPSENAQAILRAGFGLGQGPILLDEIDCYGDEAALQLCLFEYTNDCSHEEDVGVKCG